MHAQLRLGTYEFHVLLQKKNFSYICDVQSVLPCESFVLCDGKLHLFTDKLSKVKKRKV